MSIILICQEGNASLRLPEASYLDPSRPCPMHLSLWLILVCIFAIIRLYHKYNTFLNYVSHSLRITKLERIVETPIVVASWSEERMACQLLNLQLVYEVR